VIRRLAAAIAAGAAILLAAGPVVAATPTFERPTATATFGEQVAFRQAFTTPVPLARVEILLEYPASLGPFVVQVAGATPAGRRELIHRRSLAEGGHLVPNTTIRARWRLVPADRALSPTVGPPVTVTYADTRFDWRTLRGDLVRVHWYEGSDGFGRRALEIGERAVREASDFLGVSETEPIDFFVYAGQSEFYDALGPATRESVGGQAHSDIRTMFALIGPGDVTDPWVGIVIPHELAHLVFDTTVRNPYHFPPRWLNEGVATYLSEGFTASDRSAVRAAAAGDRLMPLRALGGQFPTTTERFYLAYAESVAAVDYLVREKGEEALVRLIQGYAQGVTDDEAFTAAVGVDLAGFEAAWLADLGASPPVQHGPLPGPPGPVPPGWSADPSPVPGATPGTPGTPRPGASATPADPGSDGGAGSLLSETWFLLLVAALGLLLGGGVGYLVRRRSRGGSPEPGP
jgi:hypothetical protein